jgi:hypothetical protein
MGNIELCCYARPIGQFKVLMIHPDSAFKLLLLLHMALAVIGHLVLDFDERRFTQILDVNQLAIADSKQVAIGRNN